VDSGDGFDDEPTASPVMPTPVPVTGPTAAPSEDAMTLFPTVDTNQPTLAIGGSPFLTLEPTPPFATLADSVVEASTLTVLRSKEFQASGTPSDAPSFIPSDVPSSVPSTVPTIARISSPTTVEDSVDSFGRSVFTSVPSPSSTEEDSTGGFVRVPRIPPTWDPSPSPSSGPSLSPTSGPSHSPMEQDPVIAKNVPEDSTVWLTGDPVNLQAVGSVDVNSVREPFFQHVESLMKPYMMTHVGEILKKLQLNIEFLPTKTRSISIGVTGSQSMTVSYFDVFVELEISSQGIDDVNSFQDEQATAAVAAFFRGMSLNALISALKQAGIPIDTILHAEKSMEDHIANLPSVGDEGQQIVISDPFENVQENDPLESVKPETNNDDESDKSTGLYAALVSGGVVLVVVMMAILYNRRRKRRFMIHYPGDSAEGSMFTDSNASTIKPAAITLRHKSRDDNSVQSDMSSLYHKSESRKLGIPLVPPRMPQEHESEFVNRGANVTAPSALTCLDGAQPIDRLSNQYPEFDLYSSMPASPAWPVDGITIPFSYSVDDEDYQKERRRWHDEADDLALIVIPDRPASVAASEESDDVYRYDDEENNLAEI
jgi:hypothetical protein